MGDEMPANGLVNVNIVAQELIPTPRELHERLPLSKKARHTVIETRLAIERILNRHDHRALVVVGPCSIHDLDAGLEYAKRLRTLSEELEDTLLLVMRVYFEKPRTHVGWKGFINDPFLDDSFRIGEGLSQARAFLLKIGELGLGAGTEALDPITPQYLGDLISWVAIGARTTESQTHREMASGLSAPIGFKNGTDGNVEVAINALKAVAHPHSFLGVTFDGRCAVFRTRGNRAGHIILRGGSRPNYDASSVAMAEKALKKAKVSESLMIDCSHGNSLKQHARQPLVLKDCVNQIYEGNCSIVGFMIESNLEEGKQKMGARNTLKYGVSITDACIDWPTTETCLRQMRMRLKDRLQQRIAAKTATTT